jgi:DNA (cytosine-5)-methyltransferase 3A
MNVLSLFDGMSCGQIALNKADIKYDKYFASEIKLLGIKVTQENYPNTIQLGNVIDIDSSDLPKIDLLIGGSPCFVTNTPIITKDCIKNIQDIKIGDYVLTHNNNYKKIISIGNEKKDTVRFLAQGATPTITTNNHPYYVRTRYKKWNNNLRRYEILFYDPEWMEVHKIKKNNYVGTPILKTSENPFNLTEEECFLIGLYVGDGHTRKDYRISENRPNDRHWQLIISVGDHEIDNFKNNFNELNYSLYSHTKGTHRAVFSSKRLVQLVELYCGCGAINKHFGKMLLDLPINLLKKVIEGYHFADGHLENKMLRVTTISEKLVQTLSIAVAKVYKTSCTIHFSKKPKKCTIEGRIVNQNNVWYLKYHTYHPKSSRSRIIDDVIWNPVKNISETGKVESVYNLEVEDDNSYVANTHIVHNCQNLSIAMATQHRKGLEGDKSGLFYEYYRLLTELNPTYFLLENVGSMDKKDEDIITSLLGVNPININSKLLSAQLRDRFYWTNIPGVEQPKDKNIKFNDILEYGWSERKKARCLLESDSRPSVTPIKMFHRHIKGFNTLIFKDENHYNNCLDHYKKYFYKIPAEQIDKKLLEDKIDISIYNGVRYMNQNELEITQTVPKGYTSCLTRDQAAGLLGDGWTVDVIAHILKNIKN